MTKTDTKVKVKVSKDTGVSCPNCNNSTLEYVTCLRCHGDGVLDNSHDYDDCPSCDGHGGWVYCPNCKRCY